MRHSRLYAALFVGPAFIVLAAILGWPLISAIILSLQDVRTIGSEGHWVGLANYEKIISGTKFWSASWLSLVWVLANAALQTLLALAAALVLNQKFPGVRVARTWIILTWIVPTVVVVMIWRWLFSTSGGMINPMLMQLGIIDRPVGFFATPETAMSTLIFINSWRWFPFIALMMLAGLTRIPGDLYEAARIDGAGAVKRFTRITWPLLAPTLGVLLVIGTLLSFNVFDIIWLLTSGGPAGGTRTLPVLIYETAFKGYRLSEASAVAVLATIILMIFALFATRSLADAGESR
ncbi:multiple sugar transport system permease protein [Cohaesibacter sp. ES.047]|uniref:carbohydrate ABC transporter permease n=1 Tax=Cohaesibacter sp. ES.047 TaxID=1798205 RepID=UPI000BB8A1F6|nr:sugar ABC transporter permease [Cohaesibacter sp. ES.047]SNY90203.1 multiple sugar transport system permease protein [Cohaesibacter sp. ES.047]